MWEQDALPSVELQPETSQKPISRRALPPQEHASREELFPSTSTSDKSPPPGTGSRPHGCGHSGRSRVVWRRQDPQTMEQHSTCDVVTFLGSLLRFIGVESRHKRTASWSEGLGFGIMQHQDLHQKLPPLPRQERSCCRKA